MNSVGSYIPSERFLRRSTKTLHRVAIDTWTLTFKSSYSQMNYSFDVNRLDRMWGDVLTIENT
jgi:hypothetical protein